ncbi:tetratricopeptide repeat protein [Cellulomonas sp. P5_C5]
MGKYLRVLEVTGPTSGAFDPAVWSVVGQLERLLVARRPQFEPVAKITVNVVDIDAGRLHRIDPDGAIWTVLVPTSVLADASPSVDAPLRERRRALVRLVGGVLRELLLAELPAALGRSDPMDVEPLDDVLRVMEQEDYRVEGFARPVGRGARRARTHWRIEDRARIFIEVLDRGGAVIKERLVSDLPPSVRAVEGVLGRISLTGRVVQLHHENARDYWSYDIDADELDFHFIRAEAGQPHGQYDLAMMYLEGRPVLRDPEAARQWLQLAAEGGHAPAARTLARLDDALNSH